MDSFCSLLPYVRRLAWPSLLPAEDSSIEAVHSHAFFLPRKSKIHRTLVCPVNTCENHVLFPGSFCISPIRRKQLLHPPVFKARCPAAAIINEGDENENRSDQYFPHSLLLSWAYSFSFIMPTHFSVYSAPNSTFIRQSLQYK